MTINEAFVKMQDAVNAAKDRLDGNGFVMSIQADYMDPKFRPLPDENKARYITASLIVSKEGGKEGEEYCISIGAIIAKNAVDEERLARDLESYEKMIDETVETLAGYEDKNEGLDFLTEKAAEEHEQLMAKVREQQLKVRKISMIMNAVFFAGMLLLFIIALLR